MRIGEDGIETVLHTLHAIRERALGKFYNCRQGIISATDLTLSEACRACLFALHSEVSRLLEVQHAFRQLSYFDLRRRSRLTLELTRIAISLPIVLERAIQEQRDQDREGNSDGSVLLNNHVRSLLRNSALLIEKMEHLL